MHLGVLKKFLNKKIDGKEINTEAAGKADITEKVILEDQEIDIEQKKELIEQAKQEKLDQIRAMEDEINAEETAHVHEICAGKEKDKVWAFCAGQYSNDFRGNPKYLFLYINNYRKDIVPY